MGGNKICRYYMQIIQLAKKLSILQADRIQSHREFYCHCQKG
jgi:hypothetical protein